MKLTGKQVLITGAAHRMGAAAAIACAGAGADIILHYHSSRQHAAETAAQIEALGRRVVQVQGDFTNPNTPKQIFEKADAEGMSPHILINSASVYPRSTWDSMSFEELSESYLINTYAPLALSRTFAQSRNPESVIQVLDARMVDYDSEHYAYHWSKRRLHLYHRFRVAALGKGPAECEGG